MSNDHMTEQQKLAEHLLMEYAAGCLDDACSLLMASYVTLNPHARRIMRQWEAFGGALMERNCAPVEMEQGSLEKVLASMEQGQQLQKVEPECLPSRDLCPDLACKLPKPVSVYMTSHGCRMRWQKIHAQGEAMPLPAPSSSPAKPSTAGHGYATMLVRWAPAARVPVQKRTGVKLTLIVEGALHDGQRSYRKGDLVASDKNMDERQYVADDEAGCLSLVVRERPVRIRVTRRIIRVFRIFRR